MSILKFDYPYALRSRITKAGKEPLSTLNKDQRNLIEDILRTYTNLHDYARQLEMENSTLLRENIRLDSENEFMIRFVSGHMKPIED